jgi:uncharacterized protein YjbI with pentapeptide repeats
MRRGRYDRFLVLLRSLFKMTSKPWQKYQVYFNRSFKKKDLRSKDFRGSVTRNRSFRDSDLTGADFSGCDLRGCDFTSANLEKV